MSVKPVICAFVLFLLFPCASFAADPVRCDTRTATDPARCNSGPNAVVYAEAGDDSRPEEHQRKDLETIPERQAAYLTPVILQIRRASRADAKGCETHSAEDPVLCSHEPTTVGFTKDSDDSGFMDFKLSVQYQLFPKWFTDLLQLANDDLAYNSALYLAFTGRFGQYIGTRDSSPVVGKRFNPKVFYRVWTDLDHEGYFDLTLLAHESNGQSISSADEYQAARSAQKKPEFADDQLSRGWDYLELAWKGVLKKVTNDRTQKIERTLYSYVSLKKFLPHGPMQGRAEEYNTWENNPERKPRNRVNGIAGMLKFHEKGEWLTLFKNVIFQDVKVVLGYETGTRHPFRYSTGRFEFGTKFLQLPLTLWTQRGYNSDLAQYFKRVNSYGIQLDIGSF